MPDRPYILLSCSASIDGYIGNGSPRLPLSNDADFDRVDAVRASCDAILVGAGTVRPLTDGVWFWSAVISTTAWTLVRRHGEVPQQVQQQVHQRPEDAAHQVERQVPARPQVLLHQRPEDPQPEHVEAQVHDPRVQELEGDEPPHLQPEEPPRRRERAPPVQQRPRRGRREQDLQHEHDDVARDQPARRREPAQAGAGVVLANVLPVVEPHRARHSCFHAPTTSRPARPC